MLSIICRTLGKNLKILSLELVGGRNPHDQMVVKILFILPFCLLVFGYYQSCFQTNTSLRSHYHLIQWLVHHLHLVFQTKGLVLYSSCKSAFQLEIWMLLDVAYYIIMPPLVTIMKSKDTLFHYPKCLLQTLI